MDMKLFLLKKEGEEIPVKQQIKVIANLSPFTDAVLKFDEYTSLKALFTELSKALRENDFIVIAIAEGIYNKTKIKLMSALSLETEQNAEVLKKLEEAEMSPDAVQQNAAMPKNAKVFLSKDGVYSGFAVKKGKQNIAVVVLDKAHTDSVIKQGLVPYLTGGSEAPVTNTEKPEAEEKAEQPKETAITETEKGVAIRTLNILKENDIHIAVNGNQNSNVLKEYGDDLEGFYDYFTFTPHIEDRGDYNVTDYTAQMARSAKGLSKADLGACISDIFTSDESDYICISVATDKSALVRKLYKEENETDDQFIAGAAEELFALISEKTAGNNAVGIEIAQDEAPNGEKKKMQKSTKILLAVVCVLLAAAVAVGALFFVKYRQAKREAMTTTLPETTTEAPETTTEPPVVIEQMKLSDLIRYELVNGIQRPEEPTTNAPESTTAGAIVAPDETTTEAAAPQEDTAPAAITVNGTEMDAREAIARIVEVEMGNTFHKEAIKAQAVVAYTYIKYRNAGWSIDNVQLAEAYSQEVYDAVNEVYGQYLRFGDAVAFTPFHLLSAGKTASSEIIFGTPYDYLRTVEISSDKKRDNYRSEITVTADELKTAIAAYDSTITLEEDPAQWLNIITHDAAVSTGTGYVQNMKVGSKEMSGVAFAFDVMKGKGIASPCFSISYDAESSSYKFSVFGSGYGVGMSQLGADRLAIGGRKYDKILDTFYPGTILEQSKVAEATTAETTTA